MQSLAEMEEAFDDNCNINVNVINRLFTGNARKLFEDTLNSFMEQLLFKIEHDNDIKLTQSQLRALEKYKVAISFKARKDIPLDERCCMIKKDGSTCGHRKKAGSEFCGTHLRIKYESQYKVPFSPKLLVPQITINTEKGARFNTKFDTNSVSNIGGKSRVFDDTSSTIKRMYNIKPSPKGAGVSSRYTEPQGASASARRTEPQGAGVSNGRTGPLGVSTSNRRAEPLPPPLPNDIETQTDLDINFDIDTDKDIESSTGSDFSDSLANPSESQCATLEDFGPRGELLVYDGKIYSVPDKKVLEEADFDQSLLDTFKIVGIRNGTDTIWAS